MTGPYTTEIQHSLCLFLYGHTNGFWRLVTISSHQNNLAISSDSNGLTWIILNCIQSGANLSVNNQHCINTNCFLNIALILRVIALVTNLNRAVLHNGKVAVCITLAFGGNVNTVHNEGTCGLTSDHVVIGSVNTRYNSTLIILVTCRRFLIEGCDLLGELGHTVVSGVHILVGCEQLHGVNAHVGSGYPHFDLFVLVIIQGVGILCNTGSQHRIFFCRNGQL